MNNTDANRTPSYTLKSELARLCLPETSRDVNRTLAWVNSICILFLLVGIFGAAPAHISLNPVPPIEEMAPVILETLPPPQTVATTETEEQNREPAPEVANVVVVVPDAPNIHFSVPTMGNLLAPNAMAQAPPLNPLQRVEPVHSPASLSTTGASGSRPQPSYPKLALAQGQQGTVVLLLTADAAGNIASIQIKNSSGFPILDRGTEDFIKGHWTLPAGGSTNQMFQTTINYKLQND